MNDIIAGDPAPTNPQAEAAIRSLINGGYTERIAREIIAHVGGEAQDRGYQRGRAQALAEAVNAARAKRVANALFGGDIAYNNGITDAVAAIGALLEAGESRG